MQSTGETGHHNLLGQREFSKPLGLQQWLRGIIKHNKQPVGSIRIDHVGAHVKKYCEPIGSLGDSG